MPDLRARRLNRMVLGMNWRERELVDELNPRRYRHLADDKVSGKELLETHGLPVPATLAVVERMADIAGIKKELEGHEHLVIKPARGKAGSGIAVLGPKLDDGWYGSSRTVWDESDIRHLLGNILNGEYAMRTWDRALIEERIFAGPVLGDIPLIGLPDIRVITLHGDPVMAMVRLPTRRSMGKANLHLGALGIGIDMMTGLSTGGTCRGRPVMNHPETNASLSGIPVTAWQDVLHTASQAARAFPLGYLGVDISITEDGRPVILEVNVRPGLEIQNANRKGLREELTRMLRFQPAPGPDESDQASEH